MPLILTLKKLSSAQRITWLFFGLAGVSLAVGVGVAWYQHNQNVQTVKWVKVHSSPAPSTTKPTQDAFDSYTVPADQPRYIFIPKLKVSAMVRSLGLTKANDIAAPTNVFDAGWFNQSSKPGQPGATVIDGHISSLTAHGIFYGLASLKAGDSLQVEKGDQTKLNYTVVKTVVYPADKVDMNALLSPVLTDHPGLNLISCTGSVIKGTNDFDKRVVVFTKQV